MQIAKVAQLVGISVAAAALGGCGLFKSGSSDRVEPNDANRTAAKILANVSSVTTFDETDTGNTATFKATLYDKDGNQFFGPKVVLDGKDVSYVNPGDGTSTVYISDSLAFTTGQTFTTAIQGNTAVSPPAIPQMLISSPARSTTTDTSTNPPTVTTLVYYKQTAGDPMTISWTGGDPSKPVYIFIYGTPDKNSSRRLFVADDPAQAVGDPENFGLPIPNTGTYTIPATLTERYVDSNGNTATRTVTTFNDPTTTDTSGRAFQVYVAQREVTTASPIRFGWVTAAKVTASVLPKK